MIACVWSGLGLIHLFEAVRRAGLGVDWRLSRCIKGMEDGKPGIAEDYLFVRRAMPHLGRNSWEDASAYLDFVYFDGEAFVLSGDQLGRKLADLGSAE